MFRTFFSFIGALIAYVWSFVSGPATRIIIPILLGGLFLFCIIFGISFVVVYKEIFLVLILLISLGIWIPVIRPVRNFLLAIWAIWFVVEVVAFGVVWPAIDNIFSNNPAYAELKQTIKNFSVNRTEESIVSMKKGMMNSESVKGTFGRMREKSPAYDENGDIISDLFLKEGQKVMSLGTESKKQTDRDEGMAYVLISNEHGHFVKSARALVPIRIIEWESSKKEEIKKSSTKPEWEMVKDCPIHFVGRIFSSNVGPDGERANTGEVYPDCFLENGYDYKITFSGDYTKHLMTQEHKVSWRGFSPQSQGIEKPFPDYDFGALMLRIGNQTGIHPEKDKDFIVFTTKKKGPMKIFAEINVNRFPEEYRDSKGSKVKNSTLSLKLERRPL